MSEILKISKKPNEQCVICGEELVYTKGHETDACYYCKKEFITNVKCKNDHYVCKSCYQKDIHDLIEEYCVNSKILNPVELADEIMRSKKVAMHGPEHHFLLAAVMLSCYYNKIGQEKEKKNKIRNAKERMQSISNNSCSYLGICGSAIGIAVFLSIIIETTPCLESSWFLPNELAGKILIEISKIKSAKCCKRFVFTAIDETERFLKEKLNISMVGLNDIIICNYSKYNKHCIGKKCIYNRGNYIGDEK